MLYTKVGLGVHYSFLILNVTKLCVYSVRLLLKLAKWMGRPDKTLKEHEDAISIRYSPQDINREGCS